MQVNYEFHEHAHARDRGRASSSEYKSGALHRAHDLGTAGAVVGSEG